MALSFLNRLIGCIFWSIRCHLKNQKVEVLSLFWREGVFIWALKTCVGGGVDSWYAAYFRLGVVVLNFKYWQYLGLLPNELGFNLRKARAVDAFEGVAVGLPDWFFRLSSDGDSLVDWKDESSSSRASYHSAASIRNLVQTNPLRRQIFNLESSKSG